jgi:PEP-CTERM motif
MRLPSGSIGCQRFALALAAAAMVAASPAAMAEPTHYSFTLTATGVFSYAGVVGSGYFTVDDALAPDLGPAVLVASDLAGEFSTGRDFGYAFGNTSITGTPVNPIYSVLPHVDALISFEDGVPTGITYAEDHSCTVVYHCLPNHRLSFTGSGFYVFDYPSLGATGVLSISPAIPEPSTVAMMLAGLCAAAFARRRGTA